MSRYKVAIHPESGFAVGDNQTLPVSDDAGRLVHQRHFNLAAVEGHPEAGIDFHLSVIAQDRHGFAGDFASGSHVVDDGAEIVAHKVAGQQVAALAGELVEAPVERHVVLSAGHKSPAAERRKDRADPHGPVDGQQVHGSKVELGDVHLADEILPNSSWPSPFCGAAEARAQQRLNT
jgi:hypothetical protein